MFEYRTLMMDYSIGTPRAKFKKMKDFVDTMLSKVVRDLHFSLNQSLKSDND
jgi:hypothetical protein